MGFLGKVASGLGLACRAFGVFEFRTQGVGCKAVRLFVRVRVDTAGLRECTRGASKSRTPLNSPPLHSILTDRAYSPMLVQDQGCHSLQAIWLSACSTSPKLPKTPVALLTRNSKAFQSEVPNLKPEQFLLTGIGHSVPAAPFWEYSGVWGAKQAWLNLSS